MATSSYNEILDALERERFLEVWHGERKSSDCHICGATIRSDPFGINVSKHRKFHENTDATTNN